MVDQSVDKAAAALRDAKRDMLARLLAEEGLEGDSNAIGRRADAREAPVSHAQEVVWLLDRATPNLIAYNSALAFRLEGSVDSVALQRALDALIVRHESLRTRFEARGNSAVQVIDAPSAAAFDIVDMRDVPANEREERAAAQLTNMARYAFGIDREHLFRSALIRLSDHESLLLLLTHHIVSDAWSYGVLAGELASLYNAALNGRDASLPEAPIQFGDFAAWEREHLVGDRLTEKLGYWRETLLPAVPDLQVPTDRPRGPIPSFEGGRAQLLLDKSLLDRLKALASAERATLYMVLLAAYQTLLHRWSGQDDLITGSAIAGRNRSETENVVGYFSAAIPLRSQFHADDTFRSLLTGVRSTVLGALEHQDTPAEALVHELAEQGRPGHAPLFQNVLTMQENRGAPFALPGVKVTPLEVQSGTTKFELTMLPSERADGLELLLWYRSDLFDLATANRLLQHMSTLLAAVAENAATRIAELPLLSEGEQAELRAWNQTAREFESVADITSLIQRASLNREQQPAIVCGDDSVTWSEFMARGNQLAHKLRAMGVGADVPVGLCLDRSAELVMGMYGILAAGGAYVPLLPSLPAARLATQLTESGSKVVVTTRAHAALLPGTVRSIVLDADSDDLNAMPTTAPERSIGADNLAYVLFTSGSTGVPKGVAITHGNIVHYVQSIASVLSLDLSGQGEAWHCATVSTLGADLGNTSVFAALASGGTLHVLPEELLMNAASFQAYVTSHDIDLLKITPSHLQALLGSEVRAAHLPKKWLVVGGEACPWSLAEQVMAAKKCRVLNHYGPTEATVGACTFEVGQRDVTAWAPASVPIGQPIPNASAHVLDREQQPVAVGVPGELWLGGRGIARGYLHRDDATRERFVNRNGERLYRTGDRVRRLPTGDLEFLGRFDFQVKIRGHRVELGEIDSLLMLHPAVRQAVVAFHDDRLVAFAVMASPASNETLAAYLAAQLPDYMVPGTYVRLEAMPLNTNGKVDRAKLALPTTVTEAATANNAPMSETERVLSAMWAEVLKKESVGVQENFFALGGHSLLAIRLLGKISKQFGRRLTLRTLFENPTIAALASMLEPVETGSGAGA